MNIKNALKSNKTIRELGKKVNIYLQFRQDAKDFSEYYVETASNKGDYRYSVMLLVHSLEKGMCMPNPRPFGLDKVKQLIDQLGAYPSSNRNDFEYELGISILFAWSDYFEKHGWQDEDTYAKVRHFLQDKRKNAEIVAGSKIYRPQETAVDSDVIGEVLFSRHSVRDYQDRKIDPADVQFALKCFVETPTACNRQMCRVYYIQNPELTDLLNNVVIGVPGFNKKTVQYFIITYDLASFAYSGERQQGLLNVGLCSMNFIHGLHVKGIGSCCLQWSNKKGQDVEVRKRLGLRDSERIGVVIGAGYYLDENIIPSSVRRKPEDIFKII